MATRVGDLPAREEQLDRSSRLLGAHRRERNVRPYRTLAAKGPTDELRTHVDLVIRNAKRLRKVSFYALHEARRLLDEELVASPFGRRGLHFHRVMVFDGRRVRLIGLDGCAEQRTLRITLDRP